MWQIFMIVALVALTGFYGMVGPAGLITPEQATAISIAQGMAVYREGVITYFTNNDVLNASVPMSTLRSTGALASWAIVDTRSDAAMWGNYRAADGTIYVYTAKLPQVNIISDLLAVSYRSAMVGVYRAGASMLESPLNSVGYISNAPLALMSAPDGAAVWIAQRR